MSRRVIGRAMSVVASPLAAVALVGCSAFAPALELADNQTVCMGRSGVKEPYWFGLIVRNVATQPVTLVSASAPKESGMTLLDTLVFRENLGVGADIAAEYPQIWATRAQVEGFVVEPGEQVTVGFRLTRSPGAETGTVILDHQLVTYLVQGEPFERIDTSDMRIGIAPDCRALDP